MSGEHVASNGNGHDSGNMVRLSTRRPPPMPNLPLGPVPMELALAATNFYLWLQQEYPRWEQRDREIDAKLDVILSRKYAPGAAGVPWAAFISVVAFALIALVSVYIGLSVRR